MRITRAATRRALQRRGRGEPRLAPSPARRGAGVGARDRARPVPCAPHDTRGALHLVWVDGAVAAEWRNSRFSLVRHLGRREPRVGEEGAAHQRALAAARRRDRARPSRTNARRRGRGGRPLRRSAASCCATRRASRVARSRARSGPRRATGSRATAARAPTYDAHASPGRRSRGGRGVRGGAAAPSTRATRAAAPRPPPPSVRETASATSSAGGAPDLAAPPHVVARARAGGRRALGKFRTRCRAPPARRARTRARDAARARARGAPPPPLQSRRRARRAPALRPVARHLCFGTSYGLDREACCAACTSRAATSPGAAPTSRAAAPLLGRLARGPRRAGAAPPASARRPRAAVGNILPRARVGSSAADGGNSSTRRGSRRRPHGPRAPPGVAASTLAPSHRRGRPRVAAGAAPRRSRRHRRQRRRTAAGSEPLAGEHADVAVVQRGRRSPAPAATCSARATPTSARRRRRSASARRAMAQLLFMRALPGRAGTTRAARAASTAMVALTSRCSRARMPPTGAGDGTRAEGEQRRHCAVKRVFVGDRRRKLMPKLHAARARARELRASTPVRRRRRRAASTSRSKIAPMAADSSDARAAMRRARLADFTIAGASSPLDGGPHA